MSIRYRTFFFCIVACFFASGTAAETLLQRGTYLVEGIAACGTCHARRDKDNLVISGDLAGGIRFELRGHVAYAANITPHDKTGIGRWNDRDIVRAIRAGKRPDGSRIGGMPFELYGQISDRDALAIATYLRSRKPVDHAVPRTGAETNRAGIGQWLRAKADIPRTDRVRYGAYLAGPLGRCTECHTPSNNGDKPDYKKMLGAGGVEFRGPWGQAVSGNITPDEDTGLGEYSDSQIKEMIVNGQRPNRTLVGRPMAHSFYERISGDDLDAIVAYLRSLKPVKNFIDK